MQIDDIDFSNACMDPSEVNYVIYHGNCSDGFGSALYTDILMSKFKRIRLLINQYSILVNSVYYHL